MWNFLCQFHRQRGKPTELNQNWKRDCINLSGKLCGFGIGGITNVQIMNHRFNILQDITRQYGSFLHIESKPTFYFRWPKFRYKNSTVCTLSIFYRIHIVRDDRNKKGCCIWICHHLSWKTIDAIVNFSLFFGKNLCVKYVVTSTISIVLWLKIDYPIHW